MRKVGQIRDVAREAGLSTATVSRVVNGAENVSTTTRERVLSACKKLDYFPNPAARALSTSKSRTVAAIIPTIEHSVFAKYVTAIEQTLSERDYSLVMAISNANPNEELRAAQKLLGMGAEAFILTGATHSIELMELFARRRVPHVLTSIWNEDSDSVTIGYDNASLAAHALNYLVTCGHTEIAVLHGPLEDSDRTVARKAGAMSVITDAITVEFFQTPLNVAGGKNVVGELIAKGSRFSALLCFSDVLALGAYFALTQAGTRIPEDVSVMGFDNLDWSEHIVPPLTTINLPAKPMGARVAHQLVDYLEHGQVLVSDLLSGEVIERASVKRI